MGSQQILVVESDSEQLVFVVQKHDATSLHYDFRLQVGNVMPSWAIPKGPTLDNTLKRLAMMTTDHELEYRHFEGILPEGGYGAGPVLIWDEGTYDPEIELEDKSRMIVTGKQQANEVMKEGIKKGEIKFALHGKRLKGSFALVKTKNFGPKNSWLLIKHKDEHIKKDYDAKEYEESVVSGKTISQIAEDNK